MNKLDLLKATIYNMKPDIIGITESWTHPAIFDSELHLDGFQLFRKDRAINCRGGGVLLYVNSELLNFLLQLLMVSMYGVKLMIC